MKLLCWRVGPTCNEWRKVASAQVEAQTITITIHLHFLSDEVEYCNLSVKSGDRTFLHARGVFRSM